METVSEDQKPSRLRRTRIPPKTKATEPSQDVAKRKRTFDDFFNFCNFVLAYEEQLASSSPLRVSNSAGESSHSSTPSQSSGSSSGPELSEDEDPSMGEPLPSPPQSPEGITDRLEYTSDDESWNLVTCFCRRPFAGRPMVECTSCKTWVHLFCAKIKKDQVPDSYFCPRCRASGSRKEKRRKMIQPED